MWKAECRPRCRTLCCGRQDADLGAESTVVEGRMQTSLWNPLLWKVGHRPQRGTLCCGRQGAALSEQPTAVQSQAKLTISFLNSLVCLRSQHRFAFTSGFCAFCLRTGTICLSFQHCFEGKLKHVQPTSLLVTHLFCVELILSQICFFAAFAVHL